MIEGVKLSYHMIQDRSDRAVYIQLNMGIGTRIIKEVRQIDEDGKVSWQCLTDTGVLVALSEDRKILITMYIATQPKVSAMFEGNTPGWVLRMVKKNKVHAEMQNKVKY